MTKTLTFTETEATDICGAIFSQLVEVNRTVAEGYGSVKLANRLEILHNRLAVLRVEFLNAQNAEE